MKKYICVHGHFYQPPRENPWLEIIEVQDSANPYHDWNERINRECYAPNTVSRVMGADGRVAALENNFEMMSFNIGPTLFSWLEKNDPDTYLRVIDADKYSRWENDGHGSAIAQAYNHIIMPLASDRDKETQIKWGLADFIYRFGRKPEGMWLPETAVDKKTLQMLADHGISFTILAQSQAKAVKEKGTTEWQSLSSGIDPSRSYLCELDGGRSINLFFYDGPISQAVAFEGLLASGDRFIERLKTGFSDARQWPQLLHIATDGETYGHHHRFGEMALTYALNKFKESEDVILTNYGQFLSIHPPTLLVDIHDNSSWSCAHGVERWRSDCGCKIGSGPGWNQKWRGPLRRSLEILKVELDSVFENEGEKVFKDPWEARNAYIEVILDRTRLAPFLEEHARRPLQGEDRIKAAKLMEFQRNAMLMFTSCGWFFDDVSGIETQQILKYAARAIQLCEDVSTARPEKEFLKALKEAKSNIPQNGDAEKIYCKHALPEKASLARVMANSAIVAALNQGGADGLGESYAVVENDRVSEDYGDNTLSLCRAEVSSSVTLESASFLVATLRLGGSDVTCFVKPDGDELSFGPAVNEIYSAWRRKPLTEVIRKLDSNFEGGETFMLKDLFIEQRRKTVAGLMSHHVSRFTDTYKQLFFENRRMMDYFTDAGVPIPSELRMAAQYILEKELLSVTRDLENADNLDKLADLMWDIQRWGLDVNLNEARKAAEADLWKKMNGVVKAHDLSPVPSMIKTLLSLNAAGLQIDLWRMQNLFAEVYFESGRAKDDPFYGSRQLKKLGILLSFSYAEPKTREA
ncbi:MAG: DUF3536 domain-containing protein [Nitrospinae bacterium]|nr:DUF3536 domain-containing protein [Nitrospinota bacterium]